MQTGITLRRVNTLIRKTLDVRCIGDWVRICCMSSRPEPSMPPPMFAQLLGYSGLIPFLGLSAAAWMVRGAWQAQLLYALLAYGATILSFLGAVHWGLALRDPAAPPRFLLLWGVVPSLLAWIALLWGAAGGLWILAVGLWACFAVDRTVYPRFKAEGWLGMRLALTVVASLSCIAAAVLPIR